MPHFAWTSPSTRGSMHSYPARALPDTQCAPVSHENALQRSPHLIHIASVPAGPAWIAEIKAQHTLLQETSEVANTRASSVSMHTNGDEGHAFGALGVLKQGTDSGHAEGRTGAARGGHTTEFCAAVHQTVHRGDGLLQDGLHQHAAMQPTARCLRNRCLGFAAWVRPSRSSPRRTPGSTARGHRDRPTRKRLRVRFSG